MLRPELNRAAVRFLQRLPPKHAKQIAGKIVALCSDPGPPDTRPLKGKQADYRHVDVGEYRIIYFVEGEVLRIPLIGKRNDADVYQRLKRKS